MRVLRLPAPHALRLIDSPAGSVGACIGFVSAKAIPAVSKPRAGPGVLVIRISISGTYLHGQMRDLPGCLATHPMTSRRSRDPGRSVAPRHDGASGAAPGFPIARASSLKLSGFNSGALSSPVYASRPALPLAMQDSVPAGGLRLCRAGVETCWVAMKGFSSSHPPFQTFAWRYGNFLWRKCDNPGVSIIWFSYNTFSMCALRFPKPDLDWNRQNSSNSDATWCK